MPVSIIAGEEDRLIDTDEQSPGYTGTSPIVNFNAFQGPAIWCISRRRMRCCERSMRAWQREFGSGLLHNVPR